MRTKVSYLPYVFILIVTSSFIYLNCKNRPLKQVFSRSRHSFMRFVFMSTIVHVSTLLFALSTLLRYAGPILFL